VGSTDGSHARSKESILDSAGPLYAELWISLASLLRSYTAVHGLSGNRQAVVESNDVQIRVHHGKKRFELRRSGTAVTWMRENGTSGRLEITEAGRLRSATTLGLSNEVNEEEMDMAAEAWARELMLECEQ
jgi:hypothetical protein